MPEIYDVACHYDDIQATDAYTGTTLFKAQYSSFNEAAKDGTITKRRTMSVRPGTTIPARRAVNFLSETWIIGDGNSDGIYGLPIRTAYWMKKSTGLASLLTPAQACNSSAGTSMHISAMYLKDTVNSTSDTEYDTFWNVFTSSSEPVVKGYYFKVGSKYYRVRGQHQETTGFGLAACDELDDSAVTTAIVKTSVTYDPITDTQTGTTSTISAIMLDPGKFYRYANNMDDKYTSGDYSLVTASALDVGSDVTINSLRWRVLSKEAEADAWVHHIRRD